MRRVKRKILWCVFSCSFVKKKTVILSHIKTQRLFLSTFVDFYELGFVDCSLTVLTLFGFINSYFLSSLWIFQTTQMPNLHPSPYMSQVSSLVFFLEVNILTAPDMGWFSAVFKSCGPTGRQWRPVRLHSTHEMFSFYGFSLTINWGYGSIEEMNRHRPITTQTGSCSFLSNLSCHELWKLYSVYSTGHYKNS